MSGGMSEQEVLEELAILMHKIKQELIFEFNPSKNNKRLYDLYAGHYENLSDVQKNIFRADASQIYNLFEEHGCLDY